MGRFGDRLMTQWLLTNMKLSNDMAQGMDKKDTRWNDMKWND